MDVVFGVNAAATAQVYKSRVSYVGTSQITTDIFDCTGTELKHTIQMVAPPRIPASYMGTPIQMASGGQITYDSALTVFADGKNQTTDFEVVGDIGFKDSNGRLIYKLPMITVEDASGQTTQGTYKVTFNADGTISFYGMVPWDFLQSAAYPVVIDPTVVTSSTWSTGGPTGNMIKLSYNGWLVLGTSGSASPPQSSVYLSKDDGTTWALVKVLSDPVVSGAASSMINLCEFDSVSTNVLVNLESADGSYIQVGKLDVNTGTYTALKQLSISGVYAYNADTRKDKNGIFHTVWTSYINTNTANGQKQCFYDKSTDTSGTSWTHYAVWTAGSLQWVNDCCVELRSDNTPIVVYTLQDNNNSTYALKAAVWNGSGFNQITISPDTNPKYGPTIGIDSSGKIHVFWRQYNATYTSTYNIYHAYSTDNGSTWTVETVTNDGGNNVNPEVFIDKNNNPYVFFTRMGTDSYYGLYYASLVSGVWTLKEVQAAGTSSISYPAVIWSVNNCNSLDQARIAYNDASGVYYVSCSFDSPPNAPILAAHANFDATVAQTLAWTVSDPDPGDTQSAYQLQILDVVAGVNKVDTGKTASTTPDYGLAANTLDNGKQYQWRVLTYDSQSQVGPYSAYATFYTAAAPSVILTTPASGATDASSSLTVQTSYSDPVGNPQQSFQAQLLAADNSTILDDSGTLNGTGNQYTIQTTLANNTSYNARARATNSQGITSAWAGNAFSTSFTPPAPATTTATVNTGYIAINIDNPTPTGSQPAVAYNDVYRRNSGATTWQRIATQVPVNATYADYAAASGQAYDYKVTAIGNNNTQVDSTTVSTSGVTLTGLWVHNVTSPASTSLNLSHNTAQSDDWKPTATPMQFAGRTRPVVEFGEQESYTFNVDLYLANNAANWPALRDLIRSKPTLCVRDSMGTKVFGVILDLPKTDQTWGDKTVSLSVTEIDYSEGV